MAVAAVIPRHDALLGDGEGRTALLLVGLGKRRIPVLLLRLREGGAPSWLGGSTGGPLLLLLRLGERGATSWLGGSKGGPLLLQLLLREGGATSWLADVRTPILLSFRERRASALLCSSEW